MTSGSPSDRHARRQSRERLSGDSGEPSGLTEDQRVRFGLPEAERHPMFELLAPMSPKDGYGMRRRGRSCAGRAGSWAA